MRKTAADAPGTPATAAACPRCGYDLSGAVASWRTSCPLRDVCPECALALSWGDVLSGRVPDVLRSLEHRPGRLWWLVLPRTMLTLLRPGRFWRRLPIEAEVRPARLVGALLCVALLALLLFLASVAAGAVLAAHHTHTTLLANLPPRHQLPPGFQLPPRPDLLRIGIDACLRPWEGIAPWRFYSLDSLITPLTHWACAATVLVSCSLLALPITLRRARVRPIHLVRIGGYGLLWPFGITAIAAALPSGPEWYSNTLGHRFGGTWSMRTPWFPNADRAAEVAWRAAFVALGVGSLAWLVWFPIYWHAAVKHYLRLPSPLAVLIATLAVGAVATFVLWFWFLVLTFNVRLY